jgi:outer membrane protein assembly factor BamB
MRILRFVGKALLALIVLALVGWVVFNQVMRWQTKKSLDEQATAIAAHREAQRAAPATAPTAPAADTPSAAPTASPSVPPSATGAPAHVPETPTPAAIAWTAGWSGFRGARQDGHYSAGPILTDWKALRPLWRQPLGRGFASFVAANGHAFTIEQRGPKEVAVAYDVLTGRELWTSGWDASFIENQGGPGPRATPAVHDGTVFALGATGELRALDASNGKVRWRTNILKDADAGTPDFGIATSPLLVGNTVVTVPGGGDGKSVVAYDRASGSIAWSALDDDAAYSSPVRATLGGVEQIVIFLATRVVGLSPDRGALLWEHQWAATGGNNAAQPVVVSDNRVFVSADDSGALIEIARDGDRVTAREVWRTSRMKNGFSSSVYHDGFIYGIDQGILACIDAATGELKWKGGRYGSGQTLLASGHLVITTGDGEVVLVRATPEGHQEVARTTAVEGSTWNHPALVDGFLLVRNGAQMAGFDLRPR